jgi:iron complex transport system substrate-binding protein
MKRLLAIIFMLLGSVSVYANSTQAQRLITAGPAITEIVVALGAQHAIVGTDSSSWLPAEVSVTRLGYIRQLPAEGMLALRPDLVIGSAEMAPTATLTSVRQAGIEVVVLPDGEESAGLLERIQRIAALVGKKSAGEQLQQQVAKQLAALEQGKQKLAAQAQPNIIFLLINEGRPPMIAGAGSAADSLIGMAGGMNPAHHLRNYQAISAESLLTLQPDMILLSQRHGDQAAAQLLQQYPLLAGTPAGKNQAIMLIDGKALLGGIGLNTLHQAQRVQTQLLSQVAAQ